MGSSRPVRDVVHVFLELALLWACSAAPAPVDHPAQRSSEKRQRSVPGADVVVPSPQPTEREARAASERPVLLADLEQRIEALIPAQERWRVRLSPVLPCSWPPADGCVKVLVYESSPLPTGTIKYRYHGPLTIVRCSLPSLACEVAAFEGDKDDFVEIDTLVETRWRDTDEPEREAQQCLMGMVQKQQVPRNAPAELAVYRRWLHQGGGLGASAARSVPEFSSWLGSEPSGAAPESAP